VENQLTLLDILIDYPYRTQCSNCRYDLWLSNR